MKWAAAGFRTALFIAQSDLREFDRGAQIGAKTKIIIIRLAGSSPKSMQYRLSCQFYLTSFASGIELCSAT